MNLVTNWNQQIRRRKNDFDKFESGRKEKLKEVLIAISAQIDSMGETSGEEITAGFKELKIFVKRSECNQRLSGSLEDWIIWLSPEAGFCYQRCLKCQNF